MVQTCSLIRSRIGNYMHPEDPGEACYKRRSHRLSVTDAEAALLGEAARNRMVLEIGTGLGVSTRAMALTATGMLTVDTDPWVQDVIWPELKKSFPRLVCEGVPPRDSIFDMAFIDGDHTPEAVKADLNICLNSIRPFAPIFMHDYNGALKEAAEDMGFVLVREWHTPCDLVVGVLRG